MLDKQPPWVPVYGDLWTDGKFLGLANEAKLVFLRTWMPPLAAVGGLYACALDDLAPAVTDAAVVPRALECLSDKGMVKYDKPNGVIWVVNKVKHVHRTRNTILRMRHEVRACPESPLVDAHIAKWGHILGIEARQARSV